MRHHKVISVVAALALSLGMGAGSALAAPQPVKVSEQGVVTGGYIQNTFGQKGPYETVQTLPNQECGALYTAYNAVLKYTQYNQVPTQCWATFPDNTKHPFYGVQYVYPKNIAKMGKLPVIIYTPGVVVEPGQTAPVYRRLASQGYIVVVSYTWFNWTGYTDIQGAEDLARQAADKSSPLYGHIDASRTLLTGHSAGGGTSESGGGWLLDKVEAAMPGMKILGTVPLQPGPGMAQTGAITVPTFVVSAEKDTICSDALFVRPLWKQIDKAPAWIGMIRGAVHGTAMDDPDLSVNTASILAFADWLLKGNAEAGKVFVGQDYYLAKDAAFMKVERNAKAAALN